MEERRKDQETRNDEVRPCATPSNRGFDQCGKSKTSECASSRERNLKKAPSDATHRCLLDRIHSAPGCWGNKIEVKNAPAVKQIGAQQQT